MAIPRVEVRSTRSLDWLARPYALLFECAREHGDRFALDLGAYGTFVVVSSPEDVRDVFRGDPATLHAGEGNGVLRRFLGDGSLLLLEGDEHVRERRMLLPAFSPARARAHTELVRESAEGALGAAAPGDVVSVRDAGERLALAVILRVVLGPDADAEPELEARLRTFLADSKFQLGLLHRLDDPTVESGADGQTGAWAEFRRELGAIRASFERLVARRRAGGARGGDVLSLLLDATTDDGAPLADARIRDELLTLVVTGFETTATALSWAAVWLTRTPAVWQRLRQAADLDDPYLDAVCREVLRTDPVIPIVARRLQAPFRLGSEELEAGLTVAPAILLAHHRKATWGDPEAFRPERFLEREPSPWEYLPFGGGSRRCLGMPLALLEMKVALAWQARHGALKVVDPDRIVARRRSVTVAPWPEGRGSRGLLARVASHTRQDDHDPGHAL